MMNMRWHNIFVVIISLTAVALAAGCGSATAPPVELPAPVVGKISISPPDENGQSTITGLAGAVTGGAGVLAINESLATTTTLWKLTDGLIPQAYAAVEDCVGPGRYVTLANADGSFVLVVDAQIGDNIILVLINEECVEISERISLIVPAAQGSEPQKEAGICEGIPVVGTLMDLININGSPIAIREGNGDTPNTLLFGPTVVELPGCYCTDLAFIEDIPGPETAKIVVISKEERFMWVAELNGDPWNTARKFDLAFTPLAVEWIGADWPRHVAIASIVDEAIVVRKVSIDDGSIDTGSTRFFYPPASYSVEEIVGLGVTGGFFNGGYLGAVMAKTIDPNGFIHYLVGLFETLLSFQDLSQAGGPINISAVIGTQVEDISDFVITFESNNSTKYVYLLVADAQYRIIRRIHVMIDDGGLIRPIENNDSIALFTLYGLFLDHGASDDIMPISPDVIPQRMTVAMDGPTSSAAVFYLAEDLLQTYDVCRILNFAGTPPSVNDCMSLAGSSAPHLISAEGGTESVLVGDDALENILSYTNIWF